MKILLSAMLALVCAISLSSPLCAQSFVFPNAPEGAYEVDLRMLHPNLDSDLDLFTSAYMASFRLHVDNGVHATLAVPFVVFNESDFDEESELGSIEVGLLMEQSHGSRSSSLVTASVSLPTANETSTGLILGLIADWDGFRRYAPERATLHGGYGFRGAVDELQGGLDLGVDISVPTEDNDQETELILHYGLGGAVRLHRTLEVGTEFLGTWFATDDSEDNHNHALILGGRFVNTFVRPSLFLKLYLSDGFLDQVDHVIGLRVSVGS